LSTLTPFRPLHLDMDDFSVYSVTRFSVLAVNLRFLSGTFPVLPQSKLVGVDPKSDPGTVTVEGP